MGPIGDTHPRQAMRLALSVFVVVMISLPAPGKHGSSHTAAAIRNSGFCRYEGYSKLQYDLAIRRSVYVAVRDGIRRAVDVYLPAVDGKPVTVRLPVIYESQRYVRAWKNIDGTFNTPLGIAQSNGQIQLSGNSPHQLYLPWFIRNGYIVVIADMRGAGASFGSEVEEGSLQSGLDEYDIIEWISQQPWSDGNVGMIGISYGAEAQYMAAGTNPPHLKAIFPADPEFDRFQGDAFMTGGIYRHKWLLGWEVGTNRANASSEEGMATTLWGSYNFPAFSAGAVIAPVDEDRTRELLRQAISGREEFVSIARRKEFTQMIDLGIRGELFWDEVPYSRHFLPEGPNLLSIHLERVNASNIPTYVSSGWFAIYTAAATRYFNTLTVPKKLAIGPWAHDPGLMKGDLGMSGAADDAYERFLKIEGLRWFDYHLKHIENGIMNQPAITYAVMDGSQTWTEGPSAWTWLQSDRWPVPGVKSVLLFLGKGPTGSAKSANDGLLSFDRSVLEPGGEDESVVDYTTTTGQDNRWMGPIKQSRVWGEIYANMEQNDNKGLTYTTAPLVEDVVVTGHPIVTLYATSTAADGDFIAYLEDVDGRNLSQYRTEGMLRASHRVLGDPPPYYYAGLPLPDDRRSVVKNTPPFNAGVVELQFELYPTANLFKKGHRIRVTIVGIDRDNAATAILDPAPKVTLFHSSKYPSHVELPILPSDALKKGISTIP